MTQNERVLNHLQNHGSISPKEAMEAYGIMRLGARIYDLKKEGHAIQTNKETTRNKYGDLVHYARYAMRQNDQQ